MLPCFITQSLSLQVCSLSASEMTYCSSSAPGMTAAIRCCDSGATEDCPAILKYACVLDTNAAPMEPALCHADFGGDDAADGGEALASILNGKPLLALNFSNMVMTVDEATVHESAAALPWTGQLQPSLATA